MNLTMQVKLLPMPEQSAALLATMARFNAACDALAAVAHAHRCANKVELQKLAHHDVRRDFGLSAQMTIRAIAKVCEVHKRDKTVQPRFRPHGAIVYDQRILSWKGADRVSILTLGGREVMPWVAGAYQRARLDRVRGQADLIHRDGKFYLYVVLDVGDVPEGDPSDYLGVDFGLRNIAADSDGDTFCGAHNANLRKRRAKEARYARDLNHRISEALVREALDTGRGIALENLKGIRERTTVRKARRRAHHSWAFAQLRAFLSYKAARVGVPVVAVNPKYTSQTCPCCLTVDRRSRQTRDRFLCITCGHAGPSDTTAAENISRLDRRHAAERGAA